jgi:excinuclease ABC subunit C
MKTEAVAFDPKEVLSGLPNLPGVYRMLNARGEVIYVGKARDLKKRVSSYFQKAPASPRIQLMVTQVAGIEATVTRSEGEALLLESNLIKSLAPRYNIVFRDDKSYPYILLSKHPFPRLAFYRGSLDKVNRYFGPYPNAWAVRESIQLLQKVFRLRTCEDTVFANRSRPCLLHQIQRCTAPCVGLVSETAYAEDVKNAALFLAGRQSEVMDLLTARMNEAAARQEYEQAAVLRDQLQSLRRVQESQFVASARDLDADVLACAEGGGATCVNLVMIRGGRHLGDKSFFPQNAEGCGPGEILEAFIAQHYSAQEPPPFIVCGERVDTGALQAVLEEQCGRRVQISDHPPAGERRAWVEGARENARLALAQHIGQHSTQEARVQALQQGLDLPFTVKRIECFDVSHTMGEAAVASCVVYDNFQLRNGEYRRYNIGDVTPGDDFGAMREVLRRRYSKLAAGEGRMPDLVLIDGGKGQVNAAAQVLADLGLSDMALVGVAKGEERRPGLETLVFPGEGKPIKLPADHPGLHLIQQIRDEAHRFAISGHRARRGKARTRSRLEEIAGIGAQRRQKLLARFGGLKGVMSASVEELQKVEGISRALARRIYDQLH